MTPITTKAENSKARPSSSRSVFNVILQFDLETWRTQKLRKLWRTVSWRWKYCFKSSRCTYRRHSSKRVNNAAHPKLFRLLDRLHLLPQLRVLLFLSLVSRQGRPLHFEEQRQLKIDLRKSYMVVRWGHVRFFVTFCTFFIGLQEVPSNLSCSYTSVQMEVKRWDQQRAKCVSAWQFQDNDQPFPSLAFVNRSYSSRHPSSHQLIDC